MRRLMAGYGTLALLTAAAIAIPASADETLFGYVRLSDTVPKGHGEFAQIQDWLFWRQDHGGDHRPGCGWGEDDRLGAVDQTCSGRRGAIVHIHALFARKKIGRDPDL